MLANIRTAWRWYLLLKHVADKFYIKTKNKYVEWKLLNKYRITLRYTIAESVTVYLQNENAVDNRDNQLTAASSLGYCWKLIIPAKAAGLGLL
jgi:hypothetical protein